MACRMSNLNQEIWKLLAIVQLSPVLAGDRAFSTDEAVVGVVGQSCPV